ncbi:MAG: restriction endonuclease [Chloroflexi bacterium]|nr:restriction endonuclease [Chloroflexota bacterium]
MDIVFHYPPELMSLLIETIPLLCRSKIDVLMFFQGAGIEATVTQDLYLRVQKDRDTISKFEITREVLTRLNAKGEPTLRERREILKRVVEFEEFSACWPDDQLKAKGLVAEIRRVVGVKDSFTRMHLEREQERLARQAEQQARLKAIQERQEKLSTIKKDLFALFGEKNSNKRGGMLESVLNRLFEVDNILIREAFTLKEPGVEGIAEQVDGVVEIEGVLYLVEMKWWNDPLGRGDFLSILSGYIAEVMFVGFLFQLRVIHLPQYLNAEMHYVTRC